LRKQFCRRMTSIIISPEVHYTLEVTFGIGATDAVRQHWREFSGRLGVDTIRYVAPEFQKSGRVGLSTIRERNFRAAQSLVDVLETKRDLFWSSLRPRSIRN